MQLEFFDIIIPSQQGKHNMTTKEVLQAFAFAACIALPFVLYFAFVMKP